MMELDVVCPVYKGFCYLDDLYQTIMNQKNVRINKIIFPLTIDGVESEKIKVFAKEKKIICFDVQMNEFSHSLTREKAIREYCNSDIVVMISQDIKLTNEFVFYNLTKDIDSGESVYNYARQICRKNCIEKYIREKNYPKNSFFVSKEDIEQKQIMAFFSSDACSAYNRNVFLKLNGYGGYDIMMNEDQLYSKIILEAGYKKKYCADAVVEHYHEYTLKQLYNRYYQAGVFFESTQLFKGYQTTDSGLKLALYLLKQALVHFNIPVLFRWFPDMLARYLGMKKGKKSVLKLKENR